jgi:hypothetical protein
MAPLPRVGTGPLLIGQTTIFPTASGALGVARPPPPRPGPKPKLKGQSEPVLGRRLIGGANEQRVVQIFASFRLLDGNGEPGDQEAARDNQEDAVDEDEDEETELDEYDYIPRRRYAYRREHKLAAIKYYETTWKKLKDGTFERMSVRMAARKLRITRKMLRNWATNKAKILNQKKGSCRSRQPWSQVKEEQMEIELNQRFEDARTQGRKISLKWILRHARDIYGKIHPERVVQHADGKKTYLRFRFSLGWYRGFQRRYYTSLRCGTKRAQKALEELLLISQSWLQFNRGMTVVIEGLNCGIQRNRSIPVVGRFKLSEIANID